jgi:hypothetical protein
LALVRFDDRLFTVLNQPATDRHDAAVRWRQLVDLVARAGSNSSSPAVSEALASIRADVPNVDEPLRAAAARAVAALPLPLGLLECFASDRLSVSAPVLAAAKLESDQWSALLNIADDETRQFIRTLHPELGGELEPDATEALVEREPEPKLEPAQPASEWLQTVAELPPSPSLSDVVARIERRRRKRDLQQPGARRRAAAAQAGSSALFRWECGPSGEIAWVEGAPRGALVGRSIARPHDNGGDRIDEEMVRAFAMRAPFRDAALVVAGDGAIAGEWKISGVPAFEPADGRFAGYRGVALRDVPTVPEARVGLEMLSDPDSLRELVHEIKTPLNAIIGFAEIIDGQYLGPADRRYRERAGEIVGQARLLLGAIDDLDFAAKIHSAAGQEGRRVNLAELVDRATPSLRDLIAERRAELEISNKPRVPAAAVEPELADRLLFRLCSAVFERAGEGERIRLALDYSVDQCRLSLSRPAALRGMTDAQMFDPRTPGADHGAGFSLRLVRGLARIAGGDLVASPAGLTLVFARA